MPQDRPVPGSVEDWLARAEGDLALARAPLPEGAFYEDLFGVPGAFSILLSFLE